MGKDMQRGGKGGSQGRDVDSGVMEAKKGVAFYLRYVQGVDIGR